MIVAQMIDDLKIGVPIILGPRTVVTKIGIMTIGVLSKIVVRMIDDQWILVDRMIDDQKIALGAILL